MKLRLSIALTAVCFSLTVTFGAANTRTESKTRLVFVRDEKGRLLQTAHYIWLAPNRIAVPAKLYEKFGLLVWSNREHEVSVSDGGCGVIVFTANSRRLEHPAAEDPVENHKYVLARRQRRRFYVAAGVVQQNFPQWFTTKWNDQNRTLTLQKVPDK